MTHEHLPAILYGTAWKEDDTERCVRDALAAGFRAIDTANQRKHYFELGVGQAIGKALARGEVRREDLFVQTKFTFARGQDHRLPYDPNASFDEQVRQSFARSLEHLGVASLDSLVLHGPMQGEGLVRADEDVWRAMEALHGAGAVAHLGISNVSAAQLAALVRMAKVPPTFVQNRCYARFGWDEAVRAVCNRHGIVYQGFSLLTANREVVADARTRRIAERHGIVAEQVVFALARALGILPITGTTDVAHMRMDLDALRIVLTPDEVTTLTGLRHPPHEGHP